MDCPAQWTLLVGGCWELVAAAGLVDRCVQGGSGCGGSVNRDQLNSCCPVLCCAGWTSATRNPSQVLMMCRPYSRPGGQSPSRPTSERRTAGRQLLAGACMQQASWNSWTHSNSRADVSRIRDTILTSMLTGMCRNMCSWICLPAAC